METKILLLDKINHRYRRLGDNHFRQASGLTVCLQMIANGVPGITRVEIDNVEHVHNAIQRFRPKKVLFQGVWVDEVSLQKLRATFPAIRFYLQIHSNIQFLGTEGYSFTRLAEARRNDVGLIFNDPRAAYALDGEYLPNIYSAKFIDHDPKHSMGEINVICGGSIRVMKNHVTQAVAAILYANKRKLKLNFHCNMSRSEGGEEIKMALMGLFAQYPKHSLVSIPWMEHVDFIKYCSTMDLGLQVSMSETFNIVAADYTAAGIPMVVSREIPWSPYACIANPGDADHIAETMESVRNSVGIVEESRRLLNDYSNLAKKMWGGFCDT